MYERGRGWRSGEWLATCDRCDKVVYASALRLEWTNLRVCHECFEHRHPQEFIRGVPDHQSVPWSRPADDTRVISTTLTTEDGIPILTESGQPVMTEGEVPVL